MTAVALLKAVAALSGAPARVACEALPAGRNAALDAVTIRSLDENLDSGYALMTGALILA